MSIVCISEYMDMDPLAMSSSKYQTALSTVIPASSTTAVILGHFIHPSHVSLISIHTQHIHLYRLVNDRLQLHHRQHLPTAVHHAHRIARFAATLDGIILCVSSGDCQQYVTMSWNGHALASTSFHSYDGRAMASAGRQRVVVEGSGRCAVVSVAMEKYSVIPFERIDEDFSDHSANVRYPGWVGSFQAIDERIGHVVDWVFLPGYIEPTLAILFRLSGRPAWVNRVQHDNRRDASGFAIVTINQRQQSCAVIHFQEQLPNDLHSLFACPRGGCFAVGVNCLMHLEQGSQGCAFAANVFASKLSDFRFLPILKPLECSFDNAHLVSISDDSHLLVLSDGQRLSVTVKKSGRLVTSILVTEIATDGLHQPVTQSSVLDGHLVVSSECSDLHVYKIQGLTGVSPASVPQDHMDLDENDLYLQEIEADTNSLLKSSAAGLHDLVCIDTIMQSGGASDACVSISGNPERPVQARSPRQVVSVVGRGRDASAICIATRHIPLTEHIRFPMPRSQSAFWLDAKFLLVSTPSSTLVLQSDHNSTMTEVEESEFYLEGATLCAGTLSDGVICQVHADGIRLLRGAKVFIGEWRNKCRLHSANICGRLINYVSVEGSDAVYEWNGQQLQNIFASAHCTHSGLFAHGGQTLYYRVDHQGVLDIIDVAGGGVLLFRNYLIGQSVNLLLDHRESAPKPPIVPDAIHLFASADRLFIFVVSQSILTFYSSLLDQWRFAKLEAVPVGRSTRFTPCRHGAMLFGEARAFMVYIGPRCYPRLHPFHVAVQHVSDMDDRLLMVDRSSRIRICAIDRRFDIDRFDHCLHKVYINQSSTPEDYCEARRIVYLPAVNAYVVGTCTPKEFHLPKDDYSADADQPDFIYPPGSPRPQSHQYSLSLLSPITWTFVDRIDISTTAHDMLVDLKVATMSTKSAASGRKAFVVAGVASVIGEDRPVRGRVLVADVTEIVPEPGRPETNRKFRLLASADMKTTVGVVNECRGHLLVSNGVRIILHAFENDDSLQGIAFVDSAIFSSTAASFGPLFALGDVHRGISLYAYQEDPPRIVQISRSLDQPLSRIMVASVDFLPLPPDDCLVVSSDQLGNVYSHSYSPKHPNSLNGQKLVYRGGLRLATPVVRMERCLDRLFMFCQDGACLVLSAIASSSFRPAMAMLSRIPAVCPPSAGLHPRHPFHLQSTGISDCGNLPVKANMLPTLLFRDVVFGGASVTQLRLLAAGAMIDWNGFLEDVLSWTSNSLFI